MPAEPAYGTEVPQSRGVTSRAMLLAIVLVVAMTPAAFVAGAAICLLLGLLRLRFWWWPFHPIGYIIANGWGVAWYTVPFFVGWVVKSLVIRYGGLRLYRATVPLAIGLIIGDMLNRGLWSVVSLAMRS